MVEAEESNARRPRRGMWLSWKFWLVMGVIASLTGLFAYGFTTDPKEVPSPLVGQPAPGFSVTGLRSGETLSLQDLRGQAVVLNFWASWCVACRDEASVLQAAHRRYGEEGKPVTVVGIAVQDTPQKAMQFADTFGKTYFLALDSQAGEIGLNYGLYGVPETFFINPQGVIHHKIVGPVHEGDIAKHVDAMLQEG